METNYNNLFYNISENEKNNMMSCFESHTEDFYVGEVICSFGEGSPDNQVGIIEHGEANLVYYSSAGAQTILEHLPHGSLFGQLFYFHGWADNILVVCTKDCTIRFVDYEHIVKRCSKACAGHSQLVNNLLNMMSDKTSEICEHLEILSQRSIHNKLRCFFDIQFSKNNGTSFEMPFSFSALADYLSVDRSAMMRELKYMKEKNEIVINKHTVFKSKSK